MTVNILFFSFIQKSEKTLNFRGKVPFWIILQQRKKYCQLGLLEKSLVFNFQRSTRVQ